MKRRYALAVRSALSNYERKRLVTWTSKVLILFLSAVESVVTTNLSTVVVSEECSLSLSLSQICLRWKLRLIQAMSQQDWHPDEPGTKELSSDNPETRHSQSGSDWA